MKSQLVRRLIKEDFDRCFEESGIDVLLTPTAPTEAKRLKEMYDEADPVTEYMNDLMTIPANLAGLPAISLPIGVGANQLPVGIQLMAQHRSDENLLLVAHALESSLLP